MLMWPASAMLTGNGVAFVLRVPGTQHGDWWSLNGWSIFAGTAAVSLLSKYVIKFRGSHIFNPSNFGLVLCFLLLGPEHAEPLDFWWGPMTAWLALALAIIVVGGLAILIRLRLLVIAVAFWVTFAAALGVLMGLGHAMHRALAPRPGQRALLLVGAGHLAGGPRLPVLHDHRPEDDAERAARPRASTPSSIGLLAVLLIAPAQDGVLGEGGAARRARDRLRRAAPDRARARAPSRPAASSSRSAPPRSSPTPARSPAAGIRARPATDRARRSHTRAGSRR